MSWFSKLFPSKIKTAAKKEIPEGIWTKCPACSNFLFRSELERNLNVCPKCDYHMRISARKRLELFLDPAHREEIGLQVLPDDRLKFRDTKRYKDRLLTAQRETGEKDALVVMRGKLKGQNIVVCAFEFAFIGGSMGFVVGEKFVLAVQHCIQHRLPLVCFSNSGGARMQESLISLMQMGKTSAALAQLSALGLPYISVMVDPCMGGVSASLAMLGDLNLSEPKALIGFAGPKVIEQTVRETLPEGFQRAEFLLEKGALDMIIDRRQLRDKIAGLLAKLGRQKSQPAFDFSTEEKFPKLMQTFTKPLFASANMNVTHGTATPASSASANVNASAVAAAAISATVKSDSSSSHF